MRCIDQSRLLFVLLASLFPPPSPMRLPRPPDCVQGCHAGEHRSQPPPTPEQVGDALMHHQRYR